MVIGVDISPITTNSEHKIRGVGKYITLLKNNLEKYDKKNSYIFLKHSSEITDKIDLLHIPYFDPFFIHLPINKKLKTVLTIHDLIPLVYKEHFPAGLKGSIKWLINRQLVSRVDAIIVDSNASGDDASKLINIDKSKINTVYLSCDEEIKSLKTHESDKLLNKFELPERFFLYVGDVTWNKNLPRLIDAIMKVNIPLVLVGKAIADRNYDTNNKWNLDRDKINKVIDNNNLYIKAGFVSTDELSAFYSSAIALCMPSIDEGFGLPILEAMKSGCPVITTKMGSIPEVAGEAAYFVDPFDEKGIATSLIKLSTDNKLREKLKEKGKEQSGKFSIQKMIEGTINVYENS